MNEGQHDKGWDGALIWSSYGVGLADVDMEKRDRLIGAVESRSVMISLYTYPAALPVMY